MVSLSVWFPNVRFSPASYEAGVEDVRENIRVDLRRFQGKGVTLDMTDEAMEKHVRGPGVSAPSLIVTGPTGAWTLDTVDQFIAELYSPYQSSKFAINAGYMGGSLSLIIEDTGTGTFVSVEDKEKINVLREIAKWRERAKVDERPTPSPVVFLGHGGSPQWQGLRDYVVQLGYEVEAFETLPRAGYTIKEVLEEMMEKSDIAILLMTAEDEQGDGTVRARQNVVHETGLFQGHLGFKRTIVILEEGTTDFSNIAGLQEIRYGPGNVREAFGDVATTLQREFPRA